MRSLRNSSMIAIILFMAALSMGIGDVQADSETREWKTIAGIVETGNPVGSGAGLVTGAGQPFSALGGSAELNLETGELKFEVRGLVFAGGNFIGTTGPFTEVTGTLICDTNGSAGGGESVRIDTSAVPLSPEGNARFEGTVVLDPVCIAEPDIAFLIVNPGDMWIAYGAVPEADDDDDDDEDDDEDEDEDDDDDKD